MLNHNMQKDPSCPIHPLTRDLNQIETGTTYINPGVAELILENLNKMCPKNRTATVAYKISTYPTYLNKFAMLF
jgi:hypothetical protein